MTNLISLVKQKLNNNHTGDVDIKDLLDTRAWILTEKAIDSTNKIIVPGPEQMSVLYALDIEKDSELILKKI